MKRVVYPLEKLITFLFHNWTRIAAGILFTIHFIIAAKSLSSLPDSKFRIFTLIPLLLIFLFVRFQWIKLKKARAVKPKEQHHFERRLKMCDFAWILFHLLALFLDASFIQQSYRELISFLIHGLEAGLFSLEISLILKFEELNKTSGRKVNPG